MPAPIAPLVGFVLGVAFAWANADELARSHASPIGSRSLVVVALFATLVFAPVGAYFLAFHADWSYAYFVDTQHIPSALDLALVLLDAASVPVGFVVAAHRARARQLFPLLSLVTAPIALAMLALLFTSGRLAIQATYAQYHGDFGTRPVAGSSLGYGLLLMNTLLAAGATWTTRELKRGVAVATKATG